MKAVPLEKLVPIFSLYQCASTDETRYAMNGVHFNTKTGVGQATDGHKMVESRVENWEPEGLSGPECVFIPLEACKAALKIKAKDLMKYSVSIEEGKMLLTSPESQASFLLESAGAFPDTAAIWPKEDKRPIAKIGLNAAYLLSMAKAMKNWSYGEPIVTLEVFGTMEAIRVGVNGNRGLLMPCRVDNPHVDSAPKEFLEFLFRRFPGLVNGEDEVNGADLVDFISRETVVDKALRESLKLAEKPVVTTN